MDVEILSRIQFAFTAAFHYIYPPLSIGLGLILVVMEGLYLKTKKKLYHEMTRFWVKVFALTFAMGVATGIVLEFEFGTNWASYSRFVGDIFGSALAAEGIFAFFLESGFLAILVFGWNKVGPKTHFFSTIMVSLGSMFSAVWIVVANSWQQTPAGFHLVGEGLQKRAEITDFWEMVFNPSSMERLAHTLGGAWLAGAFLVISVSAFYLLKKRHVEFAQSSLKIGLLLALFASLFQLFTGHQSALGISEHQPAKLAAFEAHYDSAAAGDLYLFGWVNDEQQQVNLSAKIPG
ncbi:MAG: cytochrome ubiquinol oxidase subunit I, partial [bacterium]